MQRDRFKICDIMSEMLDNPEGGLYNTSTAYNKLELLVEEARWEAIGWMYAEACGLMDKRQDIRLYAVPDIMDRARKELSK